MRSLILNRFRQLPLTGSKLKRLILFCLAFGLVKVNSVAAIFILSNLSPSIEWFGSVDFALALGLILGIPLNAGLPGAYPYFILKLQQTSHKSAFFFHGLLLSSCCFFIFVIIHFFGISLSETPQLTILIAVIFSLQIMASVIHKSTEKVWLALLFEAGFFLLLNGYNAYLIFNGETAAMTELKILCMGYLLLLMIYFLLKLLRFSTFKWKAYREVLAFGFPLIMSTLIIVGLTGSARIFIERWIGLEAVGVYGLYFRLSALIILIHQVINITFFKKLYTSEAQNLDDWFGKFLILIGSISVLSTFLVPFCVLPLIEIIRATWDTYQPLFIVLNFQMFFWIVIALFENIIYREQLSRRCNPVLLLVFFTMLISIGLMYHFGQLNLIKIVVANTLALYLSVEWQLHLLKQKNLRFPRSLKIIRLIISCFIIFFIYQNLF